MTIFKFLLSILLHIARCNARELLPPTCAPFQAQDRESFVFQTNDSLGANRIPYRSSRLCPVRLFSLLAGSMFTRSPHASLPTSTSSFTTTRLVILMASNSFDWFSIYYSTIIVFVLCRRALKSKATSLVLHYALTGPGLPKNIFPPCKVLQTSPSRPYL